MKSRLLFRVMLTMAVLFATALPLTAVHEVATADPAVAIPSCEDQWRCEEHAEQAYHQELQKCDRLLLLGVYRNYEHQQCREDAYERYQTQLSNCRQGRSWYRNLVCSWKRFLLGGT